MDELNPGDQFAGYVIGTLIGRGGMGSVHQAFKPGSSQVYAIKVLLPEFGTIEEYRLRFAREGKITEMLKHPNIIPIYQVGEERGLMFIVMDYIKGRTLADYLVQQRFSPETAHPILKAMALALSYAHQHGVIHRDVKPGNVLIVPNKQIYLADFGLARSENLPALTRKGLRVGTPHYMSPEQILARPLTAQSDIYALGIVAYEMLLGQLPFDGQKPHEIVHKHVSEMPPRPTVLNPRFPVAIEAVILRALAKNPEERFNSAEAFEAAYASALMGLDRAACTADYGVA
jgi:serine/threonine-protein kinase